MQQMDPEFYYSSTIIILGLAFFIIFRDQIGSLINRIRHISKAGIATDSKQKDLGPERDPRAEAEKLLADLDSSLVRETEDFIAQELTNRSIPGDEAQRVLLRYLAATHIAMSFEMTYRTIFGSQLRLLSYLNTQSLVMSSDSLRSFYVKASQVYPTAYEDYPFEKWLNYLKGSFFVREDNGLLSITIRGREFLAYLIRMGYSFDKAG